MAAAFEQALQCLADDGHHVVAVSQNQVTAAMGADAGNDFLNAAAVVETSLDAVSFLRHLHEIEHSWAGEGRFTGAQDPLTWIFYFLGSRFSTRTRFGFLIRVCGFVTSS